MPVTPSDSEVELSLEREEDDTPHVEFDISVSPSDLTLELLANKINNNDIIIPFYQRKYVWKIEQASRLIESFLMGLPVPQIFLYINEEDQLEVIDGQQRLMSIKYFFEGYFGDEDNRGRRRILKLRGISDRSEYNGKTFPELPPTDQRKLKNATLRAINIKQLSPKSGNESVFHIFERLNTGGTQLKAQEIRSAVYRGPIVTELATLNASTNWQDLLGLTKPDKNQKDVELILRLFSLFERWQHYEKPMISFLNKSMSANREFNSERASKFKERFNEVIELISTTIERPFRPKNLINSAVLEAVMITLLENKNINTESLRDRYYKLLNDEAFKHTITGPTTDTIILRDRIKVAREVLIDAYE
jgi:hypothetical protein